MGSGGPNLDCSAQGANIRFGTLGSRGKSPNWEPCAPGASPNFVFVGLGGQKSQSRIWTPGVPVQISGLRGQKSHFAVLRTESKSLC